VRKTQKQTKMECVEPEAIRAAILAANDFETTWARSFHGYVDAHGEAAFSLFSLVTAADKARAKPQIKSPNSNKGYRALEARHEAVRAIYRPFCEPLNLFIADPLGRPGKKQIPTKIIDIIALMLNLAPNEPGSGARVRSVRDLMYRAARSWSAKNSRSLPQTYRKGMPATEVGSCRIYANFRLADTKLTGTYWKAYKLTPSLVTDGVPGLVKPEWVANGIADAIGIDRVKAVFAALQARERAGTNR
jgi:hypothetical protein